MPAGPLKDELQAALATRHWEPPVAGAVWVRGSLPRRQPRYTRSATRAALASWSKLTTCESSTGGTFHCVCNAAGPQPSLQESGRSVRVARQLSDVGAATDSRVRGKPGQYAQVSWPACLAMMRLVSSTVPRYHQKIQSRNAGS